MKLFEKLQLKNTDVWYHGCSKSELLKKLDIPSCEHPLFLAKNINYASQYSKLTVDKKTGRTGQTPKAADDQSSDYVYIVTLNYENCRAFNPETDISKLDELYDGTFSAVCKLCGDNINSVSLMPRMIFDSMYEGYTNNEEFIEELFGNVLRNPSNDKFLSMLVSGELEKIEDALVKQQIEDGTDFDDDSEDFYVGPISMSFKTLQTCEKFLKKFCILHPSWKPIDKCYTMQYILEDIQKVSSCNVVLTNESMMLNSLGHSNDINSDALIVVDVNALDSIYPKPVKISSV